MLQSEQKSVNVLQDTICNFSEPGDFVLDACCGSIATSRACFLLQQHSRSIGVTETLVPLQRQCSHKQKRCPGRF